MTDRDLTPVPDLPDPTPQPERRGRARAWLRDTLGFFAEGSSRGPAVTAPLRILIVDDDESVRAMLRRALAAHQVTEAREVGGAIAALEQTEVDLVISDFHMPGMTGAELLAHVDVFYPSVHRVLFSGAVPRDIRSLQTQGIVEHAVDKMHLLALLELVADLTPRAER